MSFLKIANMNKCMAFQALMKINEKCNNAKW